MKPTVGRIVHYRLSKADAERITTARARDSERGNPVGEGSVVPLVVTAFWPGEYEGGAYLAHHGPGTTYEGPGGVNGQALLDGPDSLWVCSAPQHPTLSGCWFWPPREA
jgi:hypothetical protein